MREFVAVPISFTKELLKELDEIVAPDFDGNRSAAVRDCIRQRIREKQKEKED